AHAQQSLLCNTLHSVEARLARWLLRARDLSESQILPLTQEALAQMMGVRRNAISLVAHALQRAGIIHYARGQIEIIDLQALETTVRSSNGFLSALSADDYELIRPHLRTGDLPHDAVLVEAGDTLKRAYFPHRGVISLVVELAKGEHVQVAMIGRDSLLGTLS